MIPSKRYGSYLGLRVVILISIASAVRLPIADDKPCIVFSRICAEDAGLYFLWHIRRQPLTGGQVSRSVGDTNAVRQCLPELLHAFVGDFGVPKVQPSEPVQPLEMFQADIRDLSACKAQA